MASFMIIKKFWFYSLIIGSLPIVADTTQATIGYLPVIIILLLLIVTLLPELMLIFPSYRKGIIEAIKDGDGVMNKDDLKFFISYYAPFTCLRAIIFIVLFSMATPYDPPSEIIWALVGVGTSTALPHLKGLING